jgi:cellulose biosynthesis protein BcsQ
MERFSKELLTEQEIRSILDSLGVEYRLILESTGVFSLFVQVPSSSKPQDWANRFWEAHKQLNTKSQGVARPFQEVQFLTPRQIREDSYYEDLFRDSDEEVEHLPAPHLQHWVQPDKVDPAPKGNARRIVFYSYKGGVGRTTALVLTAMVLAQMGKRVAIVDFDLEAPGIGAILLPKRHRLPGEALSEEERQLLPDKGLADYLVELPALRQLSPSVRNSRLRDEYLIDLRPSPESHGSVHILTAGVVDEFYPQKLAYASLEDIDRAGDERNPLSMLFTHLEEYFKTEHGNVDLDYILIDSRTGIADIGGSMLFKYADGVCALFAPNDQNVEGMKVLAKYVYRMDKERRPKMVWVQTLGDRVARGTEDPQYNMLERHLHNELKALQFTGALPSVLKIDFLPALRNLNREQLLRTLEEPETVIPDYRDLAASIMNLWPSPAQLDLP